jgi:hypothetical protein
MELPLVSNSSLAKMAFDHRRANPGTGKSLGLRAVMSWL